MAFFYGYGRVSEQGFMGFDKELREGAWGGIAISPALTRDDTFGAEAANLPLEQFWKLRATRALTRLARVFHEDDAMTLADRAWDATQRRFRHQNAVFLDDPDPEKRAAAERIRDRMLMGGGTEQTTLSYEKEIDFGRSQIFQASQDPLKTDIAKLDMQALIAEISERTEALAKVRGRNSGSEAPQPLSHRIREAKSECVNAFNSIHDNLEWLIQRTAEGPGRDRLTVLLAPFVKLLERYPASAGKTSDDSSAESAVDTGSAAGENS